MAEKCRYVFGYSAEQLRNRIARVIPNAASDMDPKLVRAIGNYVFMRFRAATESNPEVRMRWVNRAASEGLASIHQLRNGSSLLEQYSFKIEAEIYRALRKTYPQEEVAMPETYD